MSCEGAVLALNSGSSSLKLGVFTEGAGEEVPGLTGSADGIGRENGTIRLNDAGGRLLLHQEHLLESQAEALERLSSALRLHLQSDVIAVGHRVVHGGPDLVLPQDVTPSLLQQLATSVHFAPLHIPDALSSIRRAQELYPKAIHIACFDTYFHRTMPERSTRLAIPARFAQQGVRRYGFHGISCESVMHRLGSPAPPRVVIAHLGGGCSVTAVSNGSSLDTSMGMSPTGGVPMGTRSGDLDPAVLLFLLRAGLNAEELEQMVNHQCGLYGLSGGEADMQELERRADAGDAAAALSVDVFCAAITKAVGGYVALLGGLDRLIFTGGIGEHSRGIRERICASLQAFGVGAEDDEKRVQVLPAQEEVQIARLARRVLRGSTT